MCMYSWTISDEDGSQLSTDPIFAEMGIKYNQTVHSIIGVADGQVLNSNWDRHINRIPGYNISSDNKRTVDNVIERIRREHPIQPHVPGTFVQGVRAKRVWQCACGVLCGTKNTQTLHRKKVAGEHAVAWTHVWAQQGVPGQPYIKVS